MEASRFSFIEPNDPVAKYLTRAEKFFRSGDQEECAQNLRKFIETMAIVAGETVGLAPEIDQETGQIESAAKFWQKVRRAIHPPPTNEIVNRVRAIREKGNDASHTTWVDDPSKVEKSSWRRGIYCEVVQSRNFTKTARVAPIISSENRARTYPNSSETARPYVSNDNRRASSSGESVTSRGAYSAQEGAQGSHGFNLWSSKVWWITLFLGISWFFISFRPGVKVVEVSPPPPSPTSTWTPPATTIPDPPTAEPTHQEPPSEPPPPPPPPPSPIFQVRGVGYVYSLIPGIRYGLDMVTGVTGFTILNGSVVISRPNGQIDRSCSNLAFQVTVLPNSVLPTNYIATCGGQRAALRVVRINGAVSEDTLTRSVPGAGAPGQFNSRYQSVPGVGVPGQFNSRYHSEPGVGAPGHVNSRYRSVPGIGQ